MTVEPTFVSPVAPNTSAFPEWENIAVEAKCPLCDYNLRGLSEPRCPECGYQFDWPSVLNPDNRKHPYLFEHHPGRNVRSFAQTLLQHLAPTKFWNTLQPFHRFRLGRAVLYWVLYAMVMLLPAAVGAVEAVRYRMRLFISRRGFPPWAPRPSLSFDFVLRSVGGWKGARMLALVVTLLAIWPWLNVLALMIFQQSMRRARIKPYHVVRCAVYSGDLILWYSLAATFAIVLLGSNPRRGQTEDLLVFLILGVFVIGVFIAVRMWIAYRRYMNFDHAFATIFTSQLIVCLTVFTILLYLAN